MKAAVISIVILIALIIVVIKWFKKKPKVDYSFNDTTIQNINKPILNNEFSKTESEIYRLSSDMLTQTIDYIALNTKEKTLEKWLNNSAVKEVPTLILGVHYLHQAWLSRGHSKIDKVSKQGIDGFEFYQNKAFEKLQEINFDSKLSTEAYTRLIRAHMGYGQVEEAREYFYKAIEKDTDKLWAYIAYSEVIQPKWGGNTELIHELLNNLPQRRLIQQIVELKLVHDSLQSEENYFEGSMEDLKKRATKLLNTIDNELLKKDEMSIHRFVLFGYMFMLANDINQKAISAKYFKKMNNHFTLYPFGLMK